MRRPDFLFLLAAAFAWSGAGCIGTSTESENTIQTVGMKGRVLLSDGRPAAGARLCVRSREVVIKDSVPSWKLLDTATAKADGRFVLGLPDRKEVFLEIREADTSKPYPEVFHHRFDSTDVRPLQWGDQALAPSGSVRGRLVPKPGAPRQNLWLGVAGSSVMARVVGVADSTGLPFRLDGLPAGTQTLTVVMLGGVMVSQHPTTSMPRAHIAGDTLTELGALIYEEAVTPRGP